MKRADFRVRCHPRYSGQQALRTSLLQTFFLLLTVLSGAAQTYTVLHTFTGRPDGRGPSAGVLRDNADALYMTTWSGGSLAYGAVVKLDGRSKESVLHSFWGGDGLGAWSGLVSDKAGNFYGTTVRGGTPEGNRIASLCDFGCGTVFKLDSNGKLTVLHAFTGGADGGLPEAGLVQDNAGNLYGVTTEGGNIECPGPGYQTGCGVVFKIDTNGKETVLHAFSGPDGWSPGGPLLRDSHGNLYGLSSYGGTSNGCESWGCGTIFKISREGKTTVLYSFPGGSGGANPEGSLAQDEDGGLYGATNGGGDPSCYLCGVIFKLDKAGKETVVYTFHGSPDGGYPEGGVIRDRLGNLFGTTSAGGLNECEGNPGCGTIFKIDASGKETVLYNFTGGSDGAEPGDGLVLDDAGNLYGTAPYGGDLSCGFSYPAGCGVVFKLTP
jgi:uncharacterized repeat protein (TIGR03803 family)